MTSSIDLGNTQYISYLSGFKNKFSYDVSNEVAGFSLATGTFLAITTTLTFDSPGDVLGDISSVRVWLDGLDSVWRKVDGFVFTRYPSAAAPDYEVGTLSFFTSTTHVLYVYVVNQTGGTVNIPDFTIRYILNTFDAPFSE